MKFAPHLLAIFFWLALSVSSGISAPEVPKDLRVAEEMIADGLGRDAIERIQSWLQKNNSSPQPAAQLLLAEAFLTDHRPADALNALPKNPAAELKLRSLLVRGAARAELGRWKEAGNAWQEALSENPPPTLALQARLGLAIALLNQNDNPGALKQLREIISASPSPGQDSARLLLVKALIAAGKLEEAEKELSNLPKESPAPVLAEGRYWKAEILSAQGRTSEARDLFRKLVEDNEGATRDVLARSYIALGQFDRAREKPADATASLEKALDRGGNPETYLTAAREYLAAAQAAQSLTTAALRLRDSVRDREEEDNKRGRFAPALLLLGSATLEAGNAEAAAADLDNLIRTYPSSPAIPGARLLLAEALVKLGQEPAARDQLRELLRSESLSPEILFQARSALAELFSKDGKFVEATAAWEEAGESAPNPALAEEALFNATLAAARSTEPSAFLRLEELFAKRYPSSKHRAALALERGRMLETKGDSAASRSALAEVAQLPGANPLQAEASLRRASSLLRTGDYPAAIAAFQEFTTTFPNSPLLPQAMASAIEARLRSREITGAQARAEFAKILVRFPTSTLAPALAFQIAQTHYEERNHGEALTAFREMAAKFPKDPLADNALYYAGLSALALGNPEEATKLLRSLPENSPLRVDARLAEIDACRASGDYAGGLQIANSLLANRNPDQRAWVEISKRRLACEFALGGTDRTNLERAVSTATTLAANSIADTADKNEANFIRGRCLDQLGREQDALQAYLDVLYARQGPAPTGPSQPEYLWFARAGAEAARIQEKKGDFRGALAIYRILENAGGPNQIAFARKIDDLRNRHFLWNEQ